MRQTSSRTMWTGSSLALAAAAFVSTLVLIEGLPSRGEAVAPAAHRAGVQRIVLAPKSAAAVVPPPVAPAAQFVVKRILPIDGAIKYGEWHWDEKNVPAGPLVMTVDLDARVLSVFRGGYEIGATAVLLGTNETPTPLGVFPVKWKEANHFSRTYDDAPMPFTMNLTADGVSIHGTTVEKGYASHGCIGVPNDFARKVFGITAVGTKVYITRGKMAKAGDSLI